MVSQQPSIAILGAGLAGLMLGRLLELASHEYIVFEREATSNARGYQGGTLDIHVEDGQRALKAAGLFEEFQTLARYNATNVLVDKDGKAFAEHGGGKEENGRPEIDRKTLREMLLRSIPKQKVRWGAKVKNVVRDGNGSINVEFDDRSVKSQFSLVVGADGAWSETRKLITPLKPLYAGMTYLTTEIAPRDAFYPSVESLAGPGNYMAFGRQRSIIARRLEDKSYQLLFGVPLPEEWWADTDLIQRPSELRQWLLDEMYCDWAVINTDIVKRSERAFNVWALYGLPKEALTWKTTPGIALVGDAAHLTIPSGEGANAALYDSFELAQQITRFGLQNVDKAVAEYEKELHPRAMALHEMAAGLAEMLHGADAQNAWAKFAESHDEAQPADLK